MIESLRIKTLKSMLWSGFESFGVAFVNFAVVVVIARLLIPEEFGVIAMLQIFLLLAQTIVDSGFSAALVRRVNLSHEDETTAFYSNVALGIMCYLILYFVAPFVARFYNLLLLADVLRVIGLIVVINSLCVVQEARLIAELRFKTLFIVSMISVVTSGIVGIFLACRGFGVWTLVWQQIVLWSMKSALLWTVGRWKPLLMYSWTSFRELFGFGWKLLVSSLLDTLFVNVYSLLIGKLYSARSAGLYSRAESMAKFPSQGLTGVFQKVAYPVMSKVQDDRVALSASFVKLISMSVWILAPLMAILVGVAKPMIALLLTDKWLPCVPYFQLLCCGMVFYPINAVNLCVLKVKGRSDLFLKIEILKKITVAVFIGVSIPFGVTGLCLAFISSSIVACFLNAMYSSTYAGVSILGQIKILLPVILLAAASCGISFGVVELMSGSTALSLIIGVLVGLTCYLVMNLLFRTQELREFRRILSDFRRGRQSV